MAKGPAGRGHQRRGRRRAHWARSGRHRSAALNLQAGIGATFRIGVAAALINAVIGVAAYLQKSPLPDESK
jgi:hypothetical protein